MATATSPIPKTQVAATVPKQGGPVKWEENYPVPEPGQGQVLVKVLYTGVCQSGQCCHLMLGTYEQLHRVRPAKAKLTNLQICIPKLAPPLAPMASPSRPSSSLTSVDTKASDGSWLSVRHHPLQSPQKPVPASHAHLQTRPASPSRSARWSASASSPGCATNASSACPAVSSTARLRGIISIIETAAFRNTSLWIGVI
jgi:hypothetical protein